MTLFLGGGGGGAAGINGSGANGGQPFSVVDPAPNNSGAGGGGAGCGENISGSNGGSGGAIITFYL
jgi:hypothetical protein